MRTALFLFVTLVSACAMAPADAGPDAYNGDPMPRMDPDLGCEDVCFMEQCRRRCWSIEDCHRIDGNYRYCAANVCYFDDPAPIFFELCVEIDPLPDSCP